MFSTLYILFILVMTHALEALPFAGRGYYGSKFHKIANKGNTNKKVYKPMYSYMDPMIFKKQMMTKMPIKGFKKGYPLLTPSLFGNLPFDKMQPGKFRPELSSFNNVPISYFKSSFFPSQTIPKQSVLTDLKDSKRIPNIYELSFENLKPNIPSVTKLKSPFDAKVDFKQFETKNQPFPNLDNAKMITIDIVKGDNLPPSTKFIKPVNINDKKDVFNVPQVEITAKNDVPNEDSVDLTIVEFGDTKTPFVGDPAPDITVKGANLPETGIDTITDVSSFDGIGKIPGVIFNKDLTTDPIGKEIGTSGEKLLPDTAITIGDIPGFIADGGLSLEATAEPIFDVSNEIQRHEKGMDVLNGNDVILTAVGTLDLNSNNLLPDLNGDNLAIGGDLNGNGILDIGIRSKGDIGNFVTSGSPGPLLVADNTDINILDNTAEQRLKPFELGVNDLSVTNDLSVNIKPIGNIVDNKVNISGANVQTTEEDVNNHGIGSVVVIRPVSFHMKVEPFGPGPYGQCREPSRVICGARFGWEHVTGMVEWCKLNCIVFMYSSYCDDDRCQCKCV